MKRYRFLLILAVLMLCPMLAACTGPTTVVFENQTVCGTIRVELTNTQTNETVTRDVPVGETVSIEVVPSVTYNYAVDYTAAGVTAEGFRCTAIQRGQVIVPQGGSQKFNLTAVTPTPGVTPQQ